MDLASLIKIEHENKPPRIVLHGVHGVGKTTYAASAPSPIFIPTEDGLTTIDVPHFPVAKTLDDVFNYMGLLIKDDHQYKTFVMDTADWMEKLIWEKVCADHNVKNIEDVGGGYGKGYTYALKCWDKTLEGFEKIRAKGMAVVILAHNEIKTYNPPDGAAYDRYQIKLNVKAATKLEEWADAVLFANFVVYTDEKEKKAVSSNERVIHTKSSPAWRTKTRYKLPETLPMDFNALLTAIKGETNNG